VQDNNPIVHGKKDNKRISSLYNESLVRRMKDILDLKDIENYRHDLRIQNMKKNGKPFMIPDNIIEILARIRAVFNASFLSLESYMRIFQRIKMPEIMNPSTSVAVDSTGFKTSIREISYRTNGQRRGRGG
jgi:hypothetical protein